MNEVLTNISSSMTSDYAIVMTVISIILLLWGIYNKIKYLCLEKASEMVAKVEKRSELTGEEKFALCMLWINEDLPKVFRNNLFKSVISNLVNFVYGNSFDYMKNYIKRKTGQDVGKLLEQIKENIDAELENDEEKESK